MATSLDRMVLVVVVRPRRCVTDTDGVGSPAATGSGIGKSRPTFDLVRTSRIGSPLRNNSSTKLVVMLAGRQIQSDRGSSQGRANPAWNYPRPRGLRHLAEKRPRNPN
jgi:hypothetical protein